MPTFIKPGFWEKKAKGYKEWLNLDLLIQSVAGGGGTNPTSTYMPYNNVGTFADSFLVNDVPNSILKTVINGNDKGLKLDFANNLYSIGNDIGGGGISIKIDDANKIIGTTFGAYPSTSVYNGLYLDLSIGFYGLFNDNTNQVGYTIDSFGVAQIGDTTGNTLNGTKLVVDAQNDIISTFYTGSQIGLKLDFPNNFYYLGSNSIGVFLDLNSQKYRFGDWDYGGANGINITIDDAAGTLVTKVFGIVDKGILIDFNTNLYYFGDFNGIVNNTYIEIHDINQKINFNSTLGKYNFSSIPVYATNAAALLGGLVVGDIYRVTGTGAVNIVF